MTNPAPLKRFIFLLLGEFSQLPRDQPRIQLIQNPRRRNLEYGKQIPKFGFGKFTDVVGIGLPHRLLYPGFWEFKIEGLKHRVKFCCGDCAFGGGGDKYDISV